MCRPLPGALVLLCSGQCLWTRFGVFGFPCTGRMCSRTCFRLVHCLCLPLGQRSIILACSRPCSCALLLHCAALNDKHVVPLVGLLSRFEVLSLFYMVPVLIRSLPLQYVTFLVVCCLRPFQFAVMFNSINMLYAVSLLFLVLCWTCVVSHLWLPCFPCAGLVPSTLVPCLESFQRWAACSRCCRYAFRGLQGRVQATITL
jgi:hypothetical protein